jgi:protein disulfide-isomerase
MFDRKFLVALFVSLVASAGAFAAADWETDYGKALAKAKAENKPVLLDFSGSDWCGPCIQMRKQVFSRPEFRSYAAKNLILVDVDYPQRKPQSDALKSQNEKLSSQYGIDVKGFPTVVLLDPAGKVLREFTGYDGESPEQVIAWIEGKKKL